MSEKANFTSINKVGKHHLSAHTFSESWLTVPETISQSAGEKVSLCFHEARQMQMEMCAQEKPTAYSTRGHSQWLKIHPHNIFDISIQFCLHSNFPSAPLTPILLPTRNAVIQSLSGLSCCLPLFLPDLLEYSQPLSPSQTLPRHYPSVIMYSSSVIHYMSPSSLSLHKLYFHSGVQ